MSGTSELVETGVLQALSGPNQAGGPPPAGPKETPPAGDGSPPSPAGVDLVGDPPRLAGLSPVVRERLNEALAIIGHEFRTPLANVQLSAEWLSNNDPSDDKYAKVRALLNDQAWSVSQMVDDLLDLVRLMTGGITLARKWVDLGKLLRDKTDQLVRRTPERYILYNALPCCFVNGDSLRLGQVFDHLLYEVVKFSIPDATVEVAAKQAEADKVLITVESRGYDLAREDCERAFEPFYRSQRQQEGLGIRLFLARGLVDLHGGRVWVSTGGLGSKFFVELPGARFRAPTPGEAGCREIDVDGVINRD